VTFGEQLIAVLAVVGSVSHKTADPPLGFVGTWDVVRVEVDRADQMHWEVKPQDPELLNRELVISKTEVHFEADEGVCKRPSWKPSVMTWSELFAKGFPRPEGGGRSTKPLPSDFEFDVAPRDRVTAYALCPGKKLRGAEVWRDAEWVVLLSAEALVMHQDSQILLVFKRRAVDAKPRASFPCEKAATATEKAICASFGRAAWDRSVAAAYQEALRGNEAATQDKIRAEQKDWLRKRDACADKTSCIDELLWRRVADLKQY
jgi:uncharacterized protein YecT (DUF1311 family)